jgi:hypothetical protein
LLDRREYGGRRLVGRSRLDGRLGRVFEGELDRFCLRLAEKLGDDGQAEIDPGDSAPVR